MSLKDSVAIAMTKAAVSAGVLLSGFRALSDDDFARIVIAERFAQAPRLDPSATSWLPFPFWLNGVVMALAGRSVEVARVTAFVLGVASAVIVLVAARWLGLSRLTALVGAVVACVLPYDAWLGVATVPEAWTAALTLLGAASLSCFDRRRLLGAIALAIACLSRYEPWPVAAVFILFCLWDARGKERSLALRAGAIALGGPVLWMLHGILAHHDALFFVTRVSEYRRAIGAGNQGTQSALIGFPWMMLRCEPELGLLALLAAGALAVTRDGASWRRFRRVFVALAALVSFLIAGDLRDGAPTHHAERVLLTAWLGLCLFTVDAFFCIASKAAARGRVLLALSGTALILLGAFVLRPWYAARDSFVDRSAEVAIGRSARSFSRPETRLLVDTPDYGYFAVVAGFGSPLRAEPFDDHDPRKPRPADAFVSVAALRARMASANATLVVSSGAHASVTRQLGPTLSQTGSWVLSRAADR